MKKTTIVAIVIFAVFWTASFGTVVYLLWGNLNWWKLTLVGGFLAVVIGAIFAPNNGYNP